MDKPEDRSQTELDRQVHAILGRQSRRSFLVAGAAAAAGAGLFKLLYDAHTVNDLQWPLRSVEEANRRLTNAIFRQQVLAPTYRAEQVTGLRINGDFGLDIKLIQDTWGLQIVGLDRPRQYPQYMNDVDLWDYRSTDDYAAQTATTTPDVKGNGKPAATSVVSPYAAQTGAPGANATPGIVLRIEDLRRLPYTEQITQFKCVEGWSQIVRWGGVRFSDFLRAYPPADIDGAPPRFVDMETEDGSYNASFDMPSLLHPQTLLCYTIDGRPLEPAHGAPLRLAMPLKYGYKQIKQIATLTYSNKRTSDYWEKRGYDWYAGL